MKREEIEKLLTRFYEGITDEQEEERLVQAFRSTSPLPDDLEAERRLFLSLHHSSATEESPVPAGFEERLTALIDRKASAGRRRWLRWGSLAASVLLVIGLGLGLSKTREEYTPKDTFNSPEEAQQALQAIITEMSQNWNEGLAQLKASQEDIKDINRDIQNEIKLH